MLITSIPEFRLQFDAELSLLRVEWAPGAGVARLRESSLELLALDRELAVRNLLLNMNTFPDISVYDQMWLGVHWMPGVVKLPVERVVLVNHQHRVHNQLAIDSMIALMRPFISFDIQYFARTISGMGWLSDSSPRLPAIMAEWAAAYGPEPDPAPTPSDRPKPENGG